MLHDFLIQLAILVISFAITVVTPFVVNFLRYLSKNQKYSEAVLLAETVVRSIEQTMVGHSGAAKKKSVELYLANKLKGVSADDIDHIIEAAVYALKQSGDAVLQPIEPESNQQEIPASQQEGQ